MTFIILIICIPLLSAALLLMIKNNTMRNIIIITSCILTASAALIISITDFAQVERYYIVESLTVNIALFSFELILALYIICVSIKHKKYHVTAITVVQAAVLAWYELSGRHLTENLSHHFFVDKLNIIMIMIIAVVGGLICIYSLSYMKNYQQHHPEVKDRRNVFFAVIFLFFAAMFGIVLCNDLVWIYLFWEITTVCSFLLIGYTKTPEAIQNSFTALLYNMIGSLFFVAGIIYFSMQFHVTELKDILTNAGGAEVALPALFLAIAGLSKSAQMPFSKWLLGAMVAPTPTSALLHSSTMVKAGVYLILRIAPLLKGNISDLDAAWNRIRKNAAHMDSYVPIPAHATIKPRFAIVE
jgi:ech hydrogenase subunit A